MTGAPRQPPAERRQSLVVVNTGDGKGKTSAAMGMALRGIARDWRVGVIQFIKSGKWKSGEAKLSEQLGIDWWSLGDDCGDNGGEVLRGDESTRFGG